MQLANQPGHIVLFGEARAGSLDADLRHVSHRLALPAFVIGPAEPDLAQAALFRRNDLIQGGEILEPELHVLQLTQDAHLFFQDVSALLGSDDFLVHGEAQDLVHILTPIVLAFEVADAELF